MTPRPPMTPQSTTAPHAMTAPPVSSLRRRDLAGLVAASGAILLAAGCGRDPAPVPTSGDVPRDPLAHLDEVRWDGRTADDVLALPIAGAASELETWGELGDDDAVLDPARQSLISFLEAAYLSPGAVRGLDDAATLEHVRSASPEYWRDLVQSAWDGGDRQVYCFAPAEGFASVGRPALSMDWFRADHDGAPALLLGGTIAWTVLDTATRAVGVVAYRVGIVATLRTGTETEAESETDTGTSAVAGSISTAALRATIHGLDACAVGESGGLVVPALADTVEQRAAQRATMATVIAAPRIAREDLLDPGSAALTGDDATNAACA